MNKEDLQYLGDGVYYVILPDGSIRIQTERHEPNTWDGTRTVTHYIHLDRDMIEKLAKMAKGKR